MKKIVIALIMVLLLCGCDKKECIKSHKEKGTCTYITCVPVGEVTSCIPHTYSCDKEICEEYEITTEEGNKIRYKVND